MKTFSVALQKTLASVGEMFKLNTYNIRHTKYDGTETDEFQRVVFERGDSVGVLLIDENTDEAILVEQFRPGVAANKSGDDPWILEVVAGSMDVEGEDPVLTAKREIEEEAPGCEVRDIRKVGSIYLSPGACSEKMHLYIAYIDSANAKETGGLADHNEDIKVVRVPTEELEEMVDTGRLNSAPAVMIVQSYLLETLHFSYV